MKVKLATTYNADMRDHAVHLVTVSALELGGDPHLGERIWFANGRYSLAVTKRWYDMDGCLVVAGDLSEHLLLPSLIELGFMPDIVRAGFPGLGEFIRDRSQANNQADLTREIAAGLGEPGALGSTWSRALKTALIQWAGEPSSITHPSL